jgi:5-methylcytosine-specific restriction endonuclease McrA
MNEEFTPEQIEKAMKAALKRKEYSDRAYKKNREKRLAEHKQYAINKKAEIAAYKHQHYLENRDEILEYERQHYIENRDRLLEYQKRYVREHKIQKVAYDKQHRLEHLEERKQHDHEYYEINKEELLKYFKEHYLIHKEERLAYQHQYHLDHPEVAKTNNALYRARLNNAEGSYTSEEFIQKCETYNNECVYCGKDDEDLGPDHVIALIKGGSNYLVNILPCCESCNKSKHDKSFEEFVSIHTQEEQECILMRIYMADHFEINKEAESNV